MKIHVSKSLLINILIAILIIPVLIFGGFLISKDRDRNSTPKIASSECLPTFRDGGGPYYLPNSPFQTKIVPDGNNGEKLIVGGYILDTSCSDPLANSVLDIWQASEEGEYEDEYYRGRIKTDKNGYFKFETVVPLGYGEGTAYRPPHIHFKVWLDGKELVTSQMFFDDVKGREGFNDEFIMQIEEKNGVIYASHNIIVPDFEI
ncbi:hypothetical protein KC678_00620 [Candidatus Dojkabacteria bacterium]|uniref:Intradiol ring-cleavage dioxygenases domain-containing protein n=1 Tax=Candidatus Dojkabacteria bacterium TaxID=2099670 RepID=A0A955IC78_9BACT|nr:hypothetical protein [Candidatus Dojkabacteria bacterium]